MIIDAHAHVFANPRIHYMPTHGTFMSVADQIAVMDSSGIDKAVILPVVNPDCLTELQGINEILTICSDYPGRFIPCQHCLPLVEHGAEDIAVRHVQ